MGTLYILRGPDKGRSIETGEEPILLGRESEHLPLSDDSISRRHALLKPAGEGWSLEDQNSSNGTFLNGRRIFGPTRVQHGDQIKVGATILVFSRQLHVERIRGPQRIRDLVDLDVASSVGDAAILSSIAASEDSVILQPPETTDQVAAWNVMFRIAEIIGTIPQVDDFLERLTDIIFDHLAVDRLVILMLQGADRQLIPHVVRYRAAGRPDRPRIIASRTIIHHVLQTQEGILCANAMTDVRFSGASNQDSIHQLGLRSVVCVPIITTGQTQGVIHLDSSMSRHTFTQEHLRLCTAIGRMAGLVIENSRLLDERIKQQRLAATGQTVAQMSHEIRNIVQGLRSGADVLEMGLKNKRLDVIESGWKISRRVLDRTAMLATNMLSFSKDRRPRFEFIQLNHLIQEVAASLKKRLEEKGVSLTLELEELPAVSADYHGLYQALQNVLFNAVDAVPDSDGRIAVRTLADAGQPRVSIVVADNGPGVASTLAAHIFEPFYSTKGQAGTGLGLAVAAKIMREMKGDIVLETIQPEGARFRLSLRTDLGERPDSEKTHGPAQAAPPR